MTEEQKIEIQKFKEENPGFFRETPPAVVEFILSEETNKKIADICEKNGVIEDTKIEGVAYRVTWVLLGGLPSGNLAMTLELGVKLVPEIAKKVADEANQFISSAMVQLKSGEVPQIKQEALKEKIIIEEKPKKPSNKDVYREQV